MMERISRMRKYFVVSLMISVAVFLAIGLSGCLNTSSGNKDYILYGNFGITKESYEADSNWDQIVQNTFGSGYRVADWNDLVQYYNTYGEDAFIQLLDGLQLSKYKSTAWLKYNGQRKQNDYRYYFLERHNHNVPSYFLVFATIDNHLVDLGSWNGISMGILAIKK